jgi:hypothetical protein
VQPPSCDRQVSKTVDHRAVLFVRNGMARRDGGRAVGAEDVEVGGGDYGHAGGAASGTRGGGAAAAAAAAAPWSSLVLACSAATSSCPVVVASPSSASPGADPEVTRLLRSARFVPLIALKHAAEAHSIRATEGERVVEAVVIFADVSGKAAATIACSCRSFLLLPFAIFLCANCGTGRCSGATSIE